MPRSARPRKPYRPHQAGAIRLAARPWKIAAVFAPIESLLDRIERDGTIDAAKGDPVFYEDSGWYEVVPALEGVIEFHARAEERHGLQVDLAALRRLAKKLKHGVPLVEDDLAAARGAIDSCKRQAQQLTEDQAQSLLTTIRIGIELDRTRLEVRA